LTIVSTFKIAAVQAAPVFLDREATVAKARELIAEAGRSGARLVVFPEAFIPTYPDWVWRIPPGQHQMLADMYAELLEQSVEIPGPVTEKLCEAARQAGIYVVMGLNERNANASNASMYNTLLYIDPDGNLMGKHQKLVPTAPERMVWAQGDGSTLEVYDTSLGKLGGLICWENYMPLARYSLYAWGTQIYLAPTWDSGEPWLLPLGTSPRKDECTSLAARAPCASHRRTRSNRRMAAARQHRMDGHRQRSRVAAPRCRSRRLPRFGPSNYTRTSCSRPTGRRASGPCRP
jgi:predicted amidohydrolase